MDRTDVEWMNICERITAGYTPAGNKRTTFASSGIQVEILTHWYNLPEKGKGVRLIDVGCGNGRLPMGLIYNGYTEINYCGIDVIFPCITFCRDAFKPWTNFKFEHNNVHNDHYWAKSARDANDFDLPIKSSFADVFWANSLFTHLGKPDATLHYLEEAYRILKPGGTAICTWRLAKNKKEVSYDPKQSMFLRSDVEGFYARAGLRLVGTRKCFNTPQIEFCAVKE